MLLDRQVQHANYRDGWGEVTILRDRHTPRNTWNKRISFVMTMKGSILTIAQTENIAWPKGTQRIMAKKFTKEDGFKSDGSNPLISTFKFCIPLV